MLLSCKAILKRVFPEGDSLIELSKVRVVEEVNQGIVAEAYYVINPEDTSSIAELPEKYEHADVIIGVDESVQSPDLIIENMAVQDYQQEGEGDRRIFRGIITGIHVEYDGNKRKVKIRVESLFRLLRNYTMFMIHIQKSPYSLIKDIIWEVFQNKIELESLIQKQFYGQEYVVQAGENVWEFLQFYCGQQGIRLIASPADSWGIERLTLLDSIGGGRETDDGEESEYEKDVMLYYNKGFPDLILDDVIPHCFQQESRINIGVGQYYDFERGYVRPAFYWPHYGYEEAPKLFADPNLVNRFLPVNDLQTEQVATHFRVALNRRVIENWHGVLHSQTASIKQGMRLYLYTTSGGEKVRSSLNGRPLVFVEKAIHIVQSEDDVDKADDLLYESESVHPLFVAMEQLEKHYSAQETGQENDQIVGLDAAQGEQETPLDPQTPQQTKKSLIYKNRAFVRDGYVNWYPPTHDHSREQQNFIMPARIHMASPVVYEEGGSTATGQENEEIKDGDRVQTDEYGRVPVTLLWEEIKPREERQTILARIATPLAGSLYGAKFDPRQGDEVLVKFTHGRPDNMVIVGSVFYHNNHLSKLLMNTQAAIIQSISKNFQTYSGMILHSYDIYKGSEIITNDSAVTGKASETFLATVPEDDEVGEDESEGELRYVVHLDYEPIDHYSIGDNSAWRKQVDYASFDETEVSGYEDFKRGKEHYKLRFRKPRRETYGVSFISWRRTREGFHRGNSRIRTDLNYERHTLKSDLPYVITGEMFLTTDVVRRMTMGSQTRDIVEDLLNHRLVWKLEEVHGTSYILEVSLYMVDAPTEPIDSIRLDFSMEKTGTRQEWVETDYGSYNLDKILQWKSYKTGVHRELIDVHYREASKGTWVLEDEYGLSLVVRAGYLPMDDPCVKEGLPSLDNSDSNYSATGAMEIYDRNGRPIVSFIWKHETFTDSGVWKVWDVNGDLMAKGPWAVSYMLPIWDPNKEIRKGTYRQYAGDGWWFVPHMGVWWYIPHYKGDEEGEGVEPEEPIQQHKNQRLVDLYQKEVPEYVNNIQAKAWLEHHDPDELPNIYDPEVFPEWETPPDIEAVKQRPNAPSQDANLPKENTGISSQIRTSKNSPGLGRS